MLLDRNHKESGLVWADGYIITLMYAWNHNLSDKRRAQLISDYILPGTSYRGLEKFPELPLYAHISEEISKNGEELDGYEIEPMFIDPVNAERVRVGFDQIGKELYRRAKQIAASDGKRYKAMVVAYKGKTDEKESEADQQRRRMKLHSEIGRLVLSPHSRVYENGKLFKGQVGELLSTLGQEVSVDAQIAKLYEMGFTGGIHIPIGNYFSLKELGSTLSK